MAGVMAVAVLAGLGLAAEPAGDAKAIQGSWAVTATAFDGRPTPADQLKGRRLVFAADTFTGYVGAEKVRSLGYTLDPTATPRRITITRPGTGETSEGVYRLEGDRLTLCYGEPGAARPAGFAPKAGDRAFLIELTRSKP